MTPITDISFYPNGRMTLLNEGAYKYSYETEAYGLDTTLHQSPQLPTIVLSLLVAELSDKVTALSYEIEALKARNA